MQAYTVASGIIVEAHQVLMVQNRRKNGSHDWSTPGGVVDPGEQVLEALRREVIEETAVVVDAWSPLLYSVDVDFVGRDMSLHAQVFRAHTFSGSLTVDDPDNVVVDGRWATHGEARGLLDASPQWVAEPLRHALGLVFDQGQTAADAASQQWRYRVTGTGREFRTELIEFDG